MRSYLTLKRMGDVALAALGLVALSPLLFLVALIVRITMGHPVLFKQERPGLHGKSFTMYKFRTMRGVSESTEVISDAQRLTAFGRFLRSTSIDELPELMNVLCGEMSLIGPRPLLTEYLPLYDSHQARRHEIRPGMTGWAQVNGRNALSWEQKFDCDVYYVDHMSAVLDMRILVLTALKVLARVGISEAGQATASRFTGGRPNGSSGEEMQ